MSVQGSKVIYPELSYTLTGIFFDVHNNIGRFAKERHYGDLIEDIFKEKGIKYNREYIIENTGDRIDFLVDEKIIVEIKAKNLILRQDYYQTQRYLHATNTKLALLVNFRNRYLKPIRVINSDKI
ncbi:MAG: GxxExxY protein [Candidatus Pacebacteria bacterium]|nr:GxxExxY protein [Candidatus Paceibacterota bacterium]